MEVKAIKLVKFLVTIGGAKHVRAYIQADRVENDLPLLLSHKSIKTAGIFKNDSCQILGR